MSRFVLPHDEPDLIARAQHGEVQAFNQLVVAYQGLAYHTALRIAGNTELAADAAQDAFISAYKHIRSLRGPFKPWLLRIVANECYNQLRTKAGC